MAKVIRILICSALFTFWEIVRSHPIADRGFVIMPKILEPFHTGTSLFSNRNYL